MSLWNHHGFVFPGIVLCMGLGKEVGLGYANIMENELNVGFRTQLQICSHISIVLLLLVCPTSYNNVHAAERMRGAIS